MTYQERLSASRSLCASSRMIDDAGGPPTPTDQTNLALAVFAACHNAALAGAPMGDRPREVVARLMADADDPNWTPWSPERLAAEVGHINALAIRALMERADQPQPMIAGSAP